MKTTSTTSDEKKYPGVAADQADGKKVTAKMEEQETCSLNNNPRNEGQIP